MMNKQKMTRAGKVDVINALKDELKKSELVVVSHQVGLSAGQSRLLRHAARANGAGIKVLKNTLAKVALEGTDFAFLQKTMKGPTVLTWSKDPVAAAKVIGDVNKPDKIGDKIKIIGGGMKQKEMSLTDVLALSTLPSMDALRGKLVGLIQAPASKLARVFQLRGEQPAS